MNIETLDQLLQVLERATNAAQVLKSEIAANDSKDINAQSEELVKALLSLDELHEEIIKWRST
jgi:hypothetical protein